MLWHFRDGTRERPFLVVCGANTLLDLLDECRYPGGELIWGPGIPCFDKLRQFQRQFLAQLDCANASSELLPKLSPKGICSKVLTLADEIVLPGRSQIRTPLHSQKITMGKTVLKVLTRDDGAPTSKPLLVGYHIGFGQDACPLAGAVVR